VGDLQQHTYLHNGQQALPVVESWVAAIGCWQPMLDCGGYGRAILVNIFAVTRSALLQLQLGSSAMHSMKVQQQLLRFGSV
jgi:hypothetical protein